MKYALEVLQGHMACGAREGKAALVLTKWILAPEQHPLGTRRSCGWKRGGEAGQARPGVKMGSGEISFIFLSHPRWPSRGWFAPRGRGIAYSQWRRNLGEKLGCGFVVCVVW